MNNNNDDDDTPLPSEEMKDPFYSSNEILTDIISKEIRNSLVLNPIEITYIKTSNGDHIITRMVYSNDGMLLLVNPCLPQYVPSRSIVIDENGQEKIINGLKVKFIPYSPLSVQGAMVPFFKKSVDIITKASEYLSSEYSKAFPIEETPLAPYASAYAKDMERYKKMIEEKNGEGSSSPSERKSVYVLDDGRVIHEISKTVN